MKHQISTGGRGHSKTYLNNLAMKKIPKDRLSIDAPIVYRHKWQIGEWTQQNYYQERIDNCIYCPCKRHMVRFFDNLGFLITSVASYQRSGISFGAEHRPECWRGKEPK